MTKLSSSSSTASGLAISNAFDFNFDVLWFELLTLIDFTSICSAWLLIALFLSNGISFGMTTGGVSHTGLSGGCGVVQVAFLVSVCFESVEVEVGEEGVISARLVTEFGDKELNDINGIKGWIFVLVDFW